MGLLFVLERKRMAPSLEPRPGKMTSSKMFFVAQEAPLSLAPML